MIALGLGVAGGLVAYFLSTGKGRDLLKRKVAAASGEIMEMVKVAREKFAAIGREFCIENKEPASRFAREI